MQDFTAASLLIITVTADWQASQYSPYSPA